MIKKILTCVTVGACLLTSCSSEDVPANIGSETGNVVFTASIPGGIQSRSSYDDGTLAQNLTYAVYDADGGHIAALDGTATFTNLQTTVSLNLVAGKTYTVVFWAEAADDTYYDFDTATGKVTVTPTGDANDAKRDAFFAYEKFTVTGAINKTVTLRRPFAQINIGTSDLAAFNAAGGSISTSGIKVIAPTVLDLRDGTTGDEEAEYIYAPSALVAESEAFPVATTPEQRWLTTNYILVGDSKTTVDVTWISDNAERQEVVYRHIPVQRNYRTNIYGVLLTNPANYNVQISPEFEGEFSDAAIMKTNEDGTVSCISPALPAGVTAEDLSGKGGVAIGADGEPIYFEATSASVNQAMKQANEIFFAPNVTIETRSHIMEVPQSGITVHGNGATLSGQEQDFSINPSYEAGSTVNLTIKNLNGVKVWGQPKAGVVYNVKMENCTLAGNGLNDGGHSLVMARGSDNDAIVNIILDGCFARDLQSAVHSIYPGKMEFNNCKFVEVAMGVNIAKKPSEPATISVNNCEFDKCGILPTATNILAYDYAAPVRVVDNSTAANSIKLTIDGCTFKNTQSEWDILLMDYREGKSWSAVDYTVKNCTPADPKMKAE